MPQFQTACKVSDIPAGKGKTVTVNGVNIALFNVGGVFKALSNTCPHRGGPLGEGDLSGTVVTCPWHGFQYDCNSGGSADGRPFSVATFETRVNNGVVEVGI
ncbi:MAG: Rieske 2Fe-2S domain-containing protein [Planctomycetes bacterium]|nr:Rieske 2Fe-2S domain-containing protein [Planctomycetota bacterium]